MGGKEDCYYSAKSVIGQLEMRRQDFKPTSLFCLKCPFTESNLAVRQKCHPHECLNCHNVGECPFCSSNKSYNKCKQCAYIYMWPGTGPRLINLWFSFAISEDNRDGYIEKGDSQLDQLILHGFINEDELVEVTLPNIPH